jgi:cytochrome oxidase Cu insertion factor (SCO1/SenC/PrrC family)
MSTILHTLKTYKWWVVISVALVSAIIFGLSVSDNNNKINSMKPTREQLDSKVEVSGTVEAAKTSDLSFSSIDQAVYKRRFGKEK